MIFLFIKNNMSLLRKSGNYISNKFGNPKSLFDAIKTRNVKSVCDFLSQGLNANEKNNDYSSSPLELAIECGDRDIVKLLLDAGANVHGENDYGITPLHRAVFHADLEIVELLLDFGANVNARDNLGDTPLHDAAKPDHSGDKFFCAKRGLAPRPDARVPKNLIVKLLLEYGADASVKNKTCDTPLHYAVKNGDLDLIKFLLEAGADINSKNIKNETALNVASLSAKDTIFEYLVSHGADINSKDRLGRTPLDCVVLYDVKDSHSGKAEILLKNNANVQLKDVLGKTPVHLLIERKRDNDRIFELFMDHKINVYMKYNPGTDDFISMTDMLKDIEEETTDQSIEENKNEGNGWTKKKLVGLERKMIKIHEENEDLKRKVNSLEAKIKELLEK